MEKDYIIIGGREYRVEVNWNATTAYLRAVGRDSIDELTKISEIRPSEITALMAACIGEGERLDGRGDSPSALDLGAVVKPEDVAAFLEIYVRQSAPRMEADGGKKPEATEASRQ